MPSSIPIPIALGRFKQLPQRASETWQGGLVRLPAWIDDGSGPEGAPYRPYGALWVSLRTGRINLQLASDGRSASPELAVGTLLEFAAKESKVLGGRPGRVEVDDEPLRVALEETLAGTGTSIAQVDDVPAVREALRSLEEAETKGRPAYPALMSAPGMSAERVRAFAEAAALFHERRPWQHLVNEDLIVVEAPEVPKGMAHISVLGNGGQQFGIAFYDSRRAFERVLDLIDPRGMRRAFGVTFGPAADFPFADVDLWEAHALPVRGPWAYPLAADFGADRILRPGPQALTHMEAVLRALADTSEDELDGGRWRREVVTFDGPVALTLSLPFLLEGEAGDADARRAARARSAVMPRLSERASAQIGRFLEQHAFESLEEVNQALEQARQEGLFDQSPEAAAGRPLTPLELAQELTYDATEATGRLRIKLAKRALAVSADCADAYVLLGEAASDPEVALDWYQKGVDAGERAIGPRRFEEEAGEFWGHIDTRPYMRARLALAQTLHTLGRHEEALDHYRALLRLNAGDNQGVRYLLLTALLERGEDEEAGALLDAYEGDIQAIWPYGRALWLFRREGDSSRARAALKEAMQANPHVVGYLFDPDPIGWTPPHFALGSEEEAVYAAGELQDGFEGTPGALAWLRKQTASLHGRRRTAKRSRVRRKGRKNR